MTAFLAFGPSRLPTHFALNRTLWAGFVQVRYQVMPGFSLSGSGRYDDTGAPFISARSCAPTTPWPIGARSFS